MAVSCPPCGGTGSITESVEYDEYDKNGKKTTKRGSKTTSCRRCGGKGYLG
jgi:hypothetical protein